MFKDVNEQYLKLTGEKDAHITKTETSIRESESEIQRLRDAVTRCVYVTLTPVNFIFRCNKNEALTHFPWAWYFLQCWRCTFGCAKGLRGAEGETRHIRSRQTKPVPEDDCGDRWPQQNQDEPWRAAHRAYKVWCFWCSCQQRQRYLLEHPYNFLRKGAEVHFLFGYLPHCSVSLLPALWLSLWVSF